MVILSSMPFLTNIVIIKVSCKLWTLGASWIFSLIRYFFSALRVVCVRILCLLSTTSRRIALPTPCYITYWHYVVWYFKYERKTSVQGVPEGKKNTVIAPLFSRSLVNVMQIMFTYCIWKMELTSFSKAGNIV